MNCSICLTKFKDPLSIPCGHVYCTECLIEYVNRDSNPPHNPNQGNELTASCPTCRGEFQLAKPDLTYLPKKYHRFVTSPARRIYLDFSSDPILEDKLKKAELRIKSYARHEEHLLKKCEALKASVVAHRDGETEAREEVGQLSKLVDKGDVENMKLRQEVERLRKRLETQNRAQMDAELRYMRDQTRAQASTPTSTSTLLPQPTVKRSVPSKEARVIKPLPKLRRGRHSSPPPTFRASTKKPRLSENPIPTQYGMDRALFEFD